MFSCSRFEFSSCIFASSFALAPSGELEVRARDRIQTPHAITLACYPLYIHSSRSLPTIGNVISAIRFVIAIIHQSNDIKRSPRPPLIPLYSLVRRRDVLRFYEFLEGGASFAGAFQHRRHFVEFHSLRQHRFFGVSEASLILALVSVHGLRSGLCVEGR